MEQERSTWPDLRYETWRETAATLQLWFTHGASPSLTLPMT